MSTEIRIGQIVLDLHDAFVELGDGADLSHYLDPRVILNVEYCLGDLNSERSFCLGGIFDFRRSCKAADELLELIGIGGNNGDIATLYSDAMREKIDALEEAITTLEGQNKERAQWLCYWANMSINLYGQKAAIMFS